MTFIRPQIAEIMFRGGKVAPDILLVVYAARNTTNIGKVNFVGTYFNV